MLIQRHTVSDDEQWAPVSDLMAVAMLVFMLIAMILFVNFNLEQRVYQEQCSNTKDMLDSEFRDDFIKWGAVLEKDLTIRFTNRRVLFSVGSSNIERDVPRGGWFAEMLVDFFPRYMGVIKDINLKYGVDEIIAVRIEGHTSSEHKNPGAATPFIKNMELSQARARKILQYVLDPLKIPKSLKYESIVRRLVTANGLSSSQLCYTENGREDKNASRRVEFKLLTNSCQKAGVYDRIRSTNPCSGGSNSV